MLINKLYFMVFRIKYYFGGRVSHVPAGHMVKNLLFRNNRYRCLSVIGQWHCLESGRRKKPEELYLSKPPLKACRVPGSGVHSGQQTEKHRLWDERWQRERCRCQAGGWTRQGSQPGRTKALCAGLGKAGPLQGSRIGYSRRALSGREEWKPKTGILKEL